MQFIIVVIHCGGLERNIKTDIIDSVEIRVK